MLTAEDEGAIKSMQIANDCCRAGSRLMLSLCFFFNFFPLRFCIINAGVLYLYFSSFQQVDEEEYGGTWELTKEGFMTSFALFLVSAIISLSLSLFVCVCVCVCLAGDVDST